MRGRLQLLPDSTGEGEAGPRESARRWVVFLGNSPLRPVVRILRTHFQLIGRCAVINTGIATNNDTDAQRLVGELISSQSLTLSDERGTLIGGVVCNDAALPGGTMGIILLMEEGSDPRSLHYRAYTNVVDTEKAVRRRMTFIASQTP